MFEGSGAAPREQPSKRDLGSLAGWGESADGANKGSFVQGYNAQIAVDDEAQILVACDVTQQANDKKPLVPMAARVVAALGKLPEVTSADAGYFREAAVEDPSLASTLLLVPPNRQKHGTTPTQPLAESSAAPTNRGGVARLGSSRGAAALPSTKTRHDGVGRAFGPTNS